MDDWEIFTETSSSTKEDFYSYLNMEDLLMEIMHTQKELVQIMISMVKAILYCYLVYLKTFEICVLQ